MSRGVGIALAAALGMAIGFSAPPGACRGGERSRGGLTVFAAASLTEAFTDLGRAYERSDPGIKVRFNFAGSQQLAAQLDLGAAADVFASADTRWMDYARDRGLIEPPSRVFARNRLVVIVPRGNPGRIDGLPGLARSGIKLVLGSEAVPVGRYGREALGRLARTRGFPADYARSVLSNVVSEEENVKSIVAKVQLGEADAGIVYGSDVTPGLARFVRVLDIPDDANVWVTYPIAVVRGSGARESARAFLEWVLSPRGQELLSKHGLIPTEAGSR